MAEIAIRAQNLSFRYPHAENNALSDLSLEIPRYSCTVILGPNGAGKSTLFSLICGLLKSEQQVEFPCFDSSKRFMSYGTQNCALYDSLSVYENLEFFGKLMDVEDLFQKILSLCDSLALTEHLQKRISSCSGGTRQRTHFAVSMLCEAPLLILDEPFNNIDPESRLLLKACLRDYLSKQKGTLVLSSHQLEALDDLWTDLIFIKSGRVKETLRKSENFRDSRLEALFFELKESSETVSR